MEKGQILPHPRSNDGKIGESVVVVVVASKNDQDRSKQETGLAKPSASKFDRI